jgi:hypothetical protein
MKFRQKIDKGYGNQMKTRAGIGSSDTSTRLIVQIESVTKEDNLNVRSGS